VSEGDDAEFVGSGGFTVDRRRAVRKLRRFQLSTTYGASLLIVRAAAASGATHVRIKQQPLWSEVRFDGEPFPYRFLQDPYAPILGEGSFAPRERALAFGLIHSLEYRPETVTVRTGAGENRYRLVMRPEGADSAREDLQRAEDEGEIESSVQIAWPGARRREARRSQITKSALAWACAMSPASIALGDTLIHDPEDDYPKGRMFEWDGAKIVLGEPADYGRRILEMYHYGIKVESIELPEAGKAFRAWVDDSKAVLDASLSGAVRNRRFTRLVRQIEGAV
jgi:hypothetical protein